MSVPKPRVALIGLGDEQVIRLAALCGEPRCAANWYRYHSHYAATETDLIVARRWAEEDVPVHLLAIHPRGVGIAGYSMRNDGTRTPRPALQTSTQNVERELGVSSQCPEIYRELAAQLVRQYSGADEPPPVLQRDGDVFKDAQVLVETTSGRPLALRHEVMLHPSMRNEQCERAVVLALPGVPDPAPWLRAFLEDVHSVDAVRVPSRPPRLASPESWHTPAERAIAQRMHQIDVEFERLAVEWDRLKSDQISAREDADAGPRRVIWEDGTELEAAVEELLKAFGFEVRNMDAETPDDAPKREDLRLTHPDLEGWEALVEVKGYSDGTRTNDTHKILRHQKRYIAEMGREPDMTLWVANAYRHMDPDDRPRTDDHVGTAAASIDAVHVLATDLYRLWALVAAGQLDVTEVVRELSAAEPGSRRHSHSAPA